MKLVYKEDQPAYGHRKGDEVKVGDKVSGGRLEKYYAVVEFFRPPHKPSSEGKISVRYNGDINPCELYVSTQGMEWIEREDRQESKPVKQRAHNEYFRTVSLGGRKSCPACKAKLPPGESIWSWGEYVNAKWRTIVHFCRNCFPHQVLFHLKSHTGQCGCVVNLVAYHGTLPEWLRLEEKKLQ